MAVLPVNNCRHREKEVSLSNPHRYVSATNNGFCAHIVYQRELREAREELAALIEYMLREFNFDVSMCMLT